jgi:hypothetical protein
MTTTPDFRELCAELVKRLDELNCNFDIPSQSALIECANDAIATPPPEPVDPSQISDGYHTFEELYEHRHALTLSLMKARPDLFWYSRRHNDGELCFGDGSWFILGAELPVAGGITYHLPMRLWDAATLTGATELEIGRDWDGHTATDVANRLMAWAPTPPPESPTSAVGDITPEHTSRRDADDLHPEVKAAYAYVDRVLHTADAHSAFGGYAWHGWAIREAFLAGCSHADSATPPPEPPTDEELLKAVRHLYGDQTSANMGADDDLLIARAVLERWGRA